MAKKKPKPMATEQAEKPKPKHRSPSRDNYAYCYIPKDMAERLTVHGKKNERSFSFMVKKAVEAYLQQLDANEAKAKDSM